MTTPSIPREAIPVDTGPRPDPTSRRALRVPHAGWRVIAAKEFGDQLLSVRFLVLLIVLGLAAAIPLYFAADRIRALAPQASGEPAIFLALFTVGSADIPFLRVDAFVTLLAPLLGIAFAFDAVNGERSEGTLPRLLAQPIYRDDVINGKFVAGMAVIGLVLTSVVALIAAFGILRLGIVPHGEEVLRLIAWVLATFVYVALWLAFGLLLSVVIRRAATAALVGFGVWFLVAVIGDLITTIVAGIFKPSDGSFEAVVGSIQVQDLVKRLLPSQLYAEVSQVILNPSVNARDVIVPSTIGQYAQAQQQVSSILSLGQSMLLVWPQFVALVALTVLCFGAAYVAFMRQEVRA